MRPTDKPSYLPIGLEAKADQLVLRFTDPLDAKSAANPDNFAVKVWSLKRTANYGSDHYNEHSLDVTAAALSDDGCVVTLTLPDLAPTWSMEIRCRLQGTAGESIERVIHNTIHACGD